MDVGFSCCVNKVVLLALLAQFQCTYLLWSCCVGGAGSNRSTSGSKDAHWSLLFGIVGPCKKYIEMFNSNLKCELCPRSPPSSGGATQATIIALWTPWPVTATVTAAVPKNIFNHGFDTASSAGQWHSR